MHAGAELAGPLRRRRSLLEAGVDSCFRLINGEGDGLEPVFVDKFGPVAVVNWHGKKNFARNNWIIDAVRELDSVISIYVKSHTSDASKAVPVALDTPPSGSRTEELAVRENCINYLIRPANGLSVGLYLDMRDIRLWLLSQVKGASVLNCFAYTCAFGVVAQTGGARRIVNIDASRKVLDWGLQNAQLNQLEPGIQEYLTGDVFSWLKRFAKREESFDWVILDPPSYATTKESRFSAGHDYPKLIAMAARVVRPGGQILACCNLSTLSRQKFHTLIKQGLREAGRTSIDSLDLYPSEIDFPVPPGEEAPLKVVAVTLG